MEKDEEKDYKNSSDEKLLEQLFPNIYLNNANPVTEKIELIADYEIKKAQSIAKIKAYHDRNKIISSSFADLKTHYYVMRSYNSRYHLDTQMEIATTIGVSGNAPQDETIRVRLIVNNKGEQSTHSYLYKEKSVDKFDYVFRVLVLYWLIFQEYGSMLELKYHLDQYFAPIEDDFLQDLSL